VTNECFITHEESERGNDKSHQVLLITWLNRTSV